MNNNKKTMTPCGGCGNDIGPVHQCPSCNVNMHPFCGNPVGKEGFGQPVLCPSCDHAQHDEEAISASPLVAAFQRTTYVRPPYSSDDDEFDGPTRVRSASFSDGDVPTQMCDQAQAALTPIAKTRSTQSVSTVQDRRMVLRWMIERESTDGIKGLHAKAVDAFPAVFTSATRNANLSKSLNWWKRREKYLDAPRGSVSVSRRSSQGRTRVVVKVIGGRGRPRSDWVTWLYPRLLKEFDRLRKLGLKFDAPLLRQVALRVLKLSKKTYNWQSIDGDGVLISQKITSRWVQTFMESNNIVLRAHTGKRQLSPEKQDGIERDVASHLGVLQRGFESGRFNEGTVENTDETHFVVDFDNGKTLGFGGEKQVKYADIVSGGEGMTIVVRISGGPSGRIMPPMMIFTNADGSYEIRGVKDNVPGVCYRRGKKGWMTKRVFRGYLREKRAMNRDRLGREKLVFLDNCFGHIAEDDCKEELAALNVKLHYLPSNATDLCQPADSFVIAKIKDVWSRKWNEKKIDLIDNRQWQNQPREDGSWSGKLKNPGKSFFLSLAADLVREVNAKRDKNGVNYARKAMIRCGLSLGLDGHWSPVQLFPRLQETIKKYPVEFAGEDHSAAAIAASHASQEAVV